MLTGNARVAAIVAAVLALFSCTVSACGDDVQRPSQPPGWDDVIRVSEAYDLNPDPNIVEVNLHAALANLSFVPGQTTTAWTYNGQVPGPLIRARVGDRVIVHLTNDLPEATTIHWHGLRIPAAMDGMPTEAQPAIAPGGGFDYDFVVPDASTFWYHPHVDSAAQVGYGLYGPLIVDDPDEPGGLGDEVVMVVSDIAIGDDGTLAPADAGGDLASYFGREGNVMLVNGQVRPTLKARPGLRQRWRIINAAKSRYFRISMPGHAFQRIGGDGGRLMAPIDVDTPVIAPGERADLVVVPQGAAGSQVVVQSAPYDRGFGTNLEPAVDLFVVQLEGSPVATEPLPALNRTLTPLSVAGATPVSIQLTADGASPLALGINGVTYADAQPYMATVGETQLWTVSNKLDSAHPFHMHGFFFQVLSPGGPLHPLEWKDTVNVPINGSVTFAVKFDDRPGMWMFHCHILDHAEAGMMGSLMVMEP
jgi:FtsP/CotA-like multicopper oxidase with cupredoxin domain